MSKALKLAAEFDRYFTSFNGVDVPERVSVSRDEWRQLHAALQAERPDASPWTENVAVKLAPSRTGRAYIAGPMTGIAEFNFPAFNKEAVRLRAEGLTVLNPADHGIVEGAEWADYLRHDIAGLATCERIHLLQGWEESKGARLEVTIAQALGMAITLADGAASPAARDPGAPVPFLLNGMRFKMSFQTDLDADLDPITTLTCFNNFENQLDGRWVALVDAEDDVHLNLRTAQPAKDTQAASAEDMKVYDSIADRYFREAAPKDHQIAALVNKVRDIARMFHDHQSLRERIAIELVPALKASQEVKSNAERWRYAIADGGNQSMNFIDIFDDWDGDGSFVEAFDKARLADKKEGSAA